MADNKVNANNKTPMGPMGRRPGGPRNMMPVEKPKNLKAVVKKLVKYIAYNKTMFFALFAIMLVVTISNLVQPIIQATIINLLTSVQMGNIEGSIISSAEAKEIYGKAISLLIVMSSIYVVNAFLTFFQTRLSAKLSQSTVLKMRNDLFAKFVKLPIKFLDTHSHGDLMSRMTNDVENISNTISQSLASLISGVLTILGTLVIMITYSWFLTIVCLLTVAMTLSVTKLLTGKMRKYYTKQAALLGQLNGHVEEMVTGYKTIVAYSKEEDVQEEFDNISHKLTHVSIMGQIWSGSMGPVMNFISNVGYVLIAFVGAYVAIKHPFGLAMEIGTIALFLNCSKQFTRPINEIANLYGQILTAMTGAERVFEIMDADNEIDKGQLEIDDDKFEGNIEFKNINFSYVEGQRVIKDFNLSVKKGQKIALVGATGSGKTTIVNLLMRFYDVDSGEILIDGLNVNDIKKDELRNTIAIVLQDTVLFKDTIATNIKYGHLDATFEEMKEASILSNVNYFVKKLPERYDTMLSEGGSNISQGQRQLLSIARAVLANPKILILDEATSSVDTRTEKNIQEAMVNLMKNRTSLIIAHRLSTIQDSDVIVVMDQGRIIEQGNHEQLLKKQGKYYELYMTQFAGKEI